MATACRIRLRSDLAVSTVGLAGPGGGSDVKPIGLIYVGFSSAAGTTAHTFKWFGNRREIQSRTAKMALNRVRLHLAGHMTK
jgi:nicotinamide-nucleotide amidase